MNILIVDDHAIVRRGLRALLSDEFPDSAITDVPTLGDALRELASESWALVLLALSMPGRGGLDALAAIHASHPETPVLVLGLGTDAQYAIRALRAGAVGCLAQDCTAEELAASSHKALAGEIYVTPELAEHLARDLRNPSLRPLHETLSNRELQVLCMLAAGTSVKQIGVELSLSDKTISTYRARVLEKMGMTSNVELARYAVQMHLVH